MIAKTKYRFAVMVISVIAAFVLLIFQLSNLTLAQGGDLAELSEKSTERTITLKGQRGQILDINGLPFAYNQSSYVVKFTRDPTKNSTTDRAHYTSMLIDTLAVITEHGGTLIDSFAMKRSAEGEFSFDFGITDPDAVAKRESNWRENMYVNKSLAPDAVYRDLRSRYRIPEEYTYEQARPLLSIWQEVQLTSYRAYLPVTIAEDVPMETVAVLESMIELDGITIEEGYTRIYPKDNVAAHIIGYMGRISDETLSEMQEAGYAPDDQVGITGIEQTMESYLTGNTSEKQGERKVTVNSRGKIVQEQSAVPATAGYDVFLTLDMEMQMVLETALESNIKAVNSIQVQRYYNDPQKYDSLESVQNRNPISPDVDSSSATTLDKINLAQSGAAVVMDVRTGEILAMASYPSYDLNLFEGGISEEDYKTLLEDTGAPLFNNAISSKGIPGSIFKMVTGTAGLIEGVITPDTIINDEGPYEVGIDESYIIAGGKTPACWVKPYFEEHAHDQTITDALQVSCNYYFMETANRLGIDKLNYWADQFGLCSSTGIELINEVSGQVGNENVLYNPDLPMDSQKTYLPYLVRNSIKDLLSSFGEIRNVEYEDDVLELAADQLMELVALQRRDIGREIREILSESMDIPETISKSNGWDNEIATSLSELMWSPNRTALTGMGTDLTAVTPIAVARYIAALVNGGKVHNVSLVDKIVDGEGNIVMEREPTLWSEIDASPEVFELIKQGMKEVVSDEDGGTASESFADWKYATEIGGKTGTGKVSQDVDLENNAWFVAFAPYDEPEIVVVTYIPHGLGGTYAIPAARDIIEYYLDGKEEQKEQTVPSPNSLVF